jgi:hypothetical protein
LLPSIDIRFFGVPGFRKPLFVSSQLFRRPINAARNILSDDMTRNSVDMVELGKALRESGFYGSIKIEVLGFDACLMNMLEVAYEMSSYAKFIVGSEELEPGKGWPYTFDVESAISEKSVAYYSVCNRPRGNR